ncbi:MAG TPA: methyltransferase, partial [Candidatus Acidoferrales bacterium]|nr:methyltransferase [Candidatus Acidoferrales bacterium]
MPTDPIPEASDLTRKATGSLKSPTGSLAAGQIAIPTTPYFTRSLILRFAEASIFLIAVVGAVALGLGITQYFAEHRYLFAYLLAYAGFRFADLLVREEPDASVDEAPEPDELSRRIRVQLPLLVMFAAAPFERTYVYGGAPPASLGALALLLELLGMWLALGARIQLGYFTSRRPGERPVLLTRAFYRYIRHPIYAGTFLVTIGWPLEFGAPVTTVVALI